MIYADANGSLPLINEVKDYLKQRIQSDLWANPNAIHSLGNKLKAGLGKSRQISSEILGAKSNQLIWTSGASESLSMVFQHLLLPKKEKTTILCSPIEHAAVIAAVNYYENVWNYKIEWIPVSKEGMVDINWIKEHVTNQTALIVCMGANNETGVIQPWEIIRDVAQKNNTPFLCDTTQLIGRTPFHFQESGLDWAMASGHKLGALPGTGFLLTTKSFGLTPLIWGGGQENGMRGGTQNYLGNETLAIALQTIPEKLKKINDHEKWRNILESQLPTEAIVIGKNHPRLSGTTLVGLPGIHGQGVQIELESQNIFVTTSSACSDNEPATSKVLKAMGIDDTLGRSVIRISLPLSAEQNDYDKVSSALLDSYRKLTKIKAY